MPSPVSSRRTVAGWRAMFAPSMAPEIVESYIDGLRLAGLPEGRSSARSRFWGRRRDNRRFGVALPMATRNPRRRWLPRSGGSPQRGAAAPRTPKLLRQRSLAYASCREVHSAGQALRMPSTAAGERRSAAAPRGQARDRGKQTLAIGIPVTKLFFDRQNTIAISSSRERPKRRAAKAVRPNIVSSSAPSSQVGGADSSVDPVTLPTR